jgi:hypothetical protein
MSELLLAGERIAPGSRRRLRLPLTHDGWFPLELEAHVLAGKSDGPTLLILSMLHGNEWFSVLVVRELLRRLSPENLAGVLVAVPVANPAAASRGTRAIQDDGDEPDANRSFGGHYLWTSNQLTRLIDEELLARADYLIDYHVGGWGAAMADVSYVADHSHPEVSRRSKDMALASGYPVLHALRIFAGHRGGRTSLGYAGETYRVPGVVVEIGGLGFGEAQERAWLEQNLECTMSIMKHLGMIEGPARARSRYLHVDDYWRVSPRQGGFLEPVVGLERQFTEAAPGELLARVTCPATLEVVEELRSPGRGVIFYMCRPYLAPPGGWAFGIANLEEGKSEWVSG